MARPQGIKIEMECFCGNTYMAKLSDLKRGWAYSCCKRCAAIRREYNKPKATPVNDLDIEKLAEMQTIVYKRKKKAKDISDYNDDCLSHPNSDDAISGSL